MTCQIHSSNRLHRFTTSYKGLSYIGQIGQSHSAISSSYTYVPFHPVVSRRILLDHNPFLHGDPGQSMVLPVDCEDAGAEARCVRVGLEQPVSHEHQQACQDDGDYRPHDIAQSGTLIKCFGRFHGVHHPKSPLTFNGMASSSQTSQKIAADTNPSRQTPMSRNHNSQ